MSNYCVFDTQAEADSYNHMAYTTWIITHNDPDYVATTTTWGEVQQRITDSKWVVPACPECDNSAQVLEEKQTDWFPSEEE